MNYLVSLLIPILEKELLALEPQVAQFLLNELKKLSQELVNWAELKLNADLNGNGKIGS